MFRKIVSNLSFSPAVAGQLTFYLRRLKAEKVTRQLSVVTAAIVLVLQFAVVIAPPEGVNASSPNDIITGGFSNKEQLAVIIQQNEELRHLFAYFRIGANEVRAASTIHYIPARTSNLYSIGRIRHASTDTVITVYGHDYYMRRLSSVATTTNASAIEGTTEDGRHFAVLATCGNIAVDFIPSPPPPPPTPLPPPPPPPLPPPPPPVVIPPPPPPPPVIPPQRYKSAIYVNRLDANGKPTLAISAKAEAGDVIEYTLTTKNVGSVTIPRYEVSEELADVLEYADIINPGGATAVNSALIWPAKDIPPNGQITNTFRIKVKTPVPVTPVSISDPLSFDLRMDNVYGEEVAISLLVPPPKQFEAASAALPETGAGSSLLLVATFVALTVFFYARNRQLVTEVSILRVDHNNGAAV